jgi:hypothetical protein
MPAQVQFHSIEGKAVTLSFLTMEANHCQTLLVEAAMLITATRLRIARSMTLLAKVALDGVRPPSTDGLSNGRLSRNSSHPPSAPPL